VPVHADAARGLRDGEVEQHQVLAGAPMPDQGGTLRAASERTPGTNLVGPRLPFVRKLELRTV
jgi:hypothetical protein